MNQSDLARMLKVSRAQISKWKAGEHLPRERESQLLELAGLFETVNVEWALFAQSKENAEGWYAYVDAIWEDVEWGDVLKDLAQDAPDLYVAHLILALRNICAQFDRQAPPVSSNHEEPSADEPLASALFSVLEAWCQYHDWIGDALHFNDSSENAEYDLSEVTGELEWLALDLALECIEEKSLQQLGVEKASLNARIKNSRIDIKSRLQSICHIRTKHGLPITANYFQMLYLPPSELAEQSWFRHPQADENTIKEYLPYGQQLALLHFECVAQALQTLDKKLDGILELLHPQ